MGTGRKFNKTNMTRPTKSVGERKRRYKEQRKRLVALGVDEAIVNKMDVKSIRELLKRPTKVKATT
jgi:hypothetical protein